MKLQRIILKWILHLDSTKINTYSNLKHMHLIVNMISSQSFHCTSNMPHHLSEKLNRRSVTY